MTTFGHRVFGHFDDAQSARAAYAALRRGMTARPEVRIHVRTPGKDHEELPIGLTDARRATVRGVLLSGVIGAITLTILVTLGARWVGFSPTYAVLGAIGGMVTGALAGFLQGSGQPHPHILSMEQEGGVLLVVSARDEEDRIWAEEILRRHQARVEAPTHAARPSYAR